jgi:hypothetical protein
MVSAPPGTTWSYSDGIHLDRASSRIFTAEIAAKLQGAPKLNATLKPAAMNMD